MRKSFCSLGLCLVVLLSACASSHVPSFALQSPSPPDLQQTMDRLATQHGVCHLAVAVIKNRKLESVKTAQGCGSRAALPPEAVFQVASLSKPVVAYAVLQLVQEGHMELDAPVMRYVPQGYVHQFEPYLRTSKTDVLTDPRLSAVTVRMLLNHSSGLPNWAGGPIAFDFEPGHHWQYSGEGYVLLQRAVETVTGSRLDALMQAQVFTPQHMRHSAFVWTPDIAANIVNGTSSHGTSVPSWQFAAPVAAFSLYSSAQDYGQFVAAVLNDAPAMQRIAQAPVVVNPKLNLYWGLGWGLEQHEDDTFLWQWGNNPGYRAFVMVSARTGDGFVMLTNSENGLAMAEPLTQYLLPGAHPVFQSHILREGVSGWLCEVLGICL